MAQLEPISYGSFNRRRKTNNKGLGITRYDILVRLPGILFAMAMPYSGMAPFGLSFLAQERRLSLGALISLVMTCLGSAVACGRIEAAKYIGAGLIYIAVLFVLEKGIIITDIAAGITAGVSVFLSGMMVMYWQGFDIMALLLLLCESVAVIAGALVMDKSRKFIPERSFSVEALNGDEKLSLGMMGAIAIMSLKEIYLGGSFSIMNLTASVIVLVVASGCGVGYSTAAGVVLGMVCGIGTEFFMPVLGAFGFCGFMAGVFSRFGKGGVIAGSVLANAVLVVYTNGAMQSMLTVYEIIGAAVVFAVLPPGLTAAMKGILCLDEKDKENIIKVKEGIICKLRSAAISFEAMSRTLEKLSDREKEADVTDIASLFDAAADKICRTCRKSGICWGKGFNTTYQAMFKLLEIMEQKGFVEETDVSDHLRVNCNHIPKLLNELNRQFDMYQLRRVWKSKLSESRELVGEQIAGVSRIIGNIAEEISEDIRFDMVSAEDIRARLEGKGIRLKNMNVLQDRNGRYKVELTVKKCYLNKKGEDTIKSIMKAVLNREVVMRELLLEDRKTVRLEFCEEEKYAVRVDCACMGASEKSGDNYRFSRLSCGKFVIMLSDGMGTGHRAAKESEAIIELLDSFIEAGFDSTVAVKLINSIMIMKSENEAFVTIDMCIIDLYTGEAEFIKTGAEPSFVMQKNDVLAVKSASLPVGVIPGAEADVMSYIAREGDVIVMVTDGVESRETGNGWIKEFIEKNRNNSSNKIADRILSRAIEENGGNVKDDMTVLTAHIYSKEEKLNRITA